MTVPPESSNTSPGPADSVPWEVTEYRRHVSAVEAALSQLPRDGQGNYRLGHGDLIAAAQVHVALATLTHQVLAAEAQQETAGHLSNIALSMDGPDVQAEALILLREMVTRYVPPSVRRLCPAMGCVSCGRAMADVAHRRTIDASRTDLYCFSCADSTQLPATAYLTLPGRDRVVD